MTQKELKQLSNDLINGEGKDRLSTLTEEERNTLLGILKDRLQNSVAALRETMEEARQLFRETREEIAYTKNELSRVKGFSPVRNESNLLN